MTTTSQIAWSQGDLSQYQEKGQLKSEAFTQLGWVGINSSHLSPAALTTPIYAQTIPHTVSSSDYFTLSFLTSDEPTLDEDGIWLP